MGGGSGFDIQRRNQPICKSVYAHLASRGFRLRARVKQRVAAAMAVGVLRNKVNEPKSHSSAT